MYKRQVRAWEERTIAFAREYAPRGVGVVVVSSNDVRQYPTDSFDAMRERAAEKSYPFPYLFDESQDAARAYGAQVTPHYYVFRRVDGEWSLAYQGRFDDHKDSPMSVKRRYVAEAVDAALADKGAPVANTPALGCSVKWKD